MVTGLLAGLILIAGQAPAVRQPAPTQAAEAPVVAEARAFMDRYSRLLIAGDRPGIAALYSRQGAMLQGFGGDRFMDHQRIAAFYAGPAWSPPATFSFDRLRYEAIGPNAAAVTGRFTYAPSSGEPTIASYTALLVREQGELRIRIEHESAVPS